MNRLQGWILKDLKRHFGGTVTPKADIFLLLITDYFLSQLVFGPLFVMTWRGFWQNADILLDTIIFKGRVDISSYFCFGFGFLVTILIQGSHTHIAKLSHKYGRLWHILVSRIFTIMIFFGDLINWKGVWGIVYLYIGVSYYVSAAFLLIFSAFFLVFQCFISFIGPPSVLVLDIRENYIDIPTFFLTKFNKDGFLKYIWDSVFTWFLKILGVLPFYGIYTFYELYFDDFNSSVERRAYKGIITWGIGSLISFISFIYQFFILWMHEVIDKDSNRDMQISKEIHYRIWLFGNFVAHVTQFKGVWSILEGFILVDSPFASRLLCQFIGLGFMLLLGCSATFHTGISREKFRKDFGILLNNFYATYFFSEINKGNKDEETSHTNKIEGGKSSDVEFDILDPESLPEKERY